MKTKISRVLKYWATILDGGENKTHLSYDQQLLNEYKDYWLYTDMEEDEIDIIKKAKNYTMTSPERMLSLIRTVKYVIKNNIEGDFVECGVWRGGSMMITALVLMNMKITNRKILLFDTFEGMSPPTNNDVDYKGDLANANYLKNIDADKNLNNWCYSSLDDVKANLFSTGYPKDKIHFIKGKVEDTLPNDNCDKIALLRLDTDWYESTHHELKYLFPLISKKGFLIIDDFGHWKGARKAVEEYFIENNIDMFLNRVDYSCRLGQKMLGK